VRPAIIWTDWAAIAVLFVAGMVGYVGRGMLAGEFSAAALMGWLPLATIVTVRVMPFAGHLDELTVRDWYDINAGIPGEKMLFRMISALHRFFSRPTRTGGICFYLSLALSGYGIGLMVLSVTGWLGWLVLVCCTAAFAFLVYPLVVRRERSSWPDI